MIRFLLLLLVCVCAARCGRGLPWLWKTWSSDGSWPAFARGHGRPQIRPEEPLFWVVLSKAWNGWRSAVLMVKPATIIAWYQRVSRGYWWWRSRRPFYPRIPDDHIALIRRISSENPQGGEDKIAEELAVKLGVRHSTSTIRKYMPRT